MTFKKSKISIVIPVYNEADLLGECLEAIKRLKTQPYEVIVVDNNSTDYSHEIATSFSSVRLINEPKQGVVYARTTGFRAARGDIIARIDADTILPPDWLDKISQIMADESVAAVSGSANYYDFIFDATANRLDRLTRKYVAKGLGDRLFLHGANMAVRKSAWDQVSDNLCNKSHIHEDFDLAIHLQEAGLVVVYEPSLVAGISSRRLSSSFKDFISYSLVSTRTYADHGLRCQRYMYPVIFFCWLIYFPTHIIYLSYDPISGGLSLSYFFTNKLRASRIDPTTNVA